MAAILYGPEQHGRAFLTVCYVSAQSAAATGNGISPTAGLISHVCHYSPHLWQHLTKLQAPEALITLSCTSDVPDPSLACTERSATAPCLYNMLVVACDRCMDGRDDVHSGAVHFVP